MSSKNVTVSNWARSNQVPVSNWYTVRNWAIHVMQYLDYCKCQSVIATRSVIGTLVATKDGQRHIAFCKDEFDLDMNSDPAILLRPSMELQYLCEGLNIQNHKSTCHILAITNRL